MRAPAMRENELTKKYSVSDMFDYLKYIHSVKINNFRLALRITNATHALLKKPEIDIT